MSKTITKYLLALCLICNVGNVFAQHRYYCEVKGIEKDLSSGLKIIFDFGTKASYNIWGDLSSKLKFVDENGEEIKFNSMVDAANYMVDKGGELPTSLFFCLWRKAYNTLDFLQRCRKYG